MLTNINNIDTNNTNISIYVYTVHISGTVNIISINCTYYKTSKHGNHAAVIFNCIL